MVLMSGEPKLYTLQYLLYKYLTQENNLEALMNSTGQVNADVLKNALNSRAVEYTVSMATIIPILLVYPFMMRYFQKGIMIGAVKG
jgi:multiple sugar transport system permease protein/putative aldouronate transport system permease protein